MTTLDIVIMPINVIEILKVFVKIAKLTSKANKILRYPQIL